MGGLAFATPGADGSPPLKVPRMSPAVYKTLRAKLIPLLSQFYHKVGTSQEAPGKTSHGDIDFLVEGPINTTFTPDDVAAAFEAVRHVKNGTTRSFAVPHPEEPDAFVQVDTHVCADGWLDWECFHQSYADLWQIIGVAHRSLGLTANDKGLHVRIQEIEEKNRKASMLFLTDDRLRVLQFYGLDAARYDRGFEEMDELFEWVTQGRFFNRKVLEARAEKANDRQRLKQRDMYRRFIQEWMPSHAEAGVKEKEWTRQEVLEEALREFGKQGAYDKIKHDIQVQEEEEALWKKISGVVPREGSGLGRVLKALKIWVRFEDGQPVVRIVPKLGVQGRSGWVRSATDQENLLRWVEENWEDVRAKEKERQAELDVEKDLQKRRMETGEDGEQKVAKLEDIGETSKRTKGENAGQEVTKVEAIGESFQTTKGEESGTVD